MVVRAVDGTTGDVDPTGGWSSRVGWCTATWLVLAGVAVGFDLLSDRAGWAFNGRPDDPSASSRPVWSDPDALAMFTLTVLVGSLVLGMIGGSILPRRVHPTAFGLPVRPRGESVDASGLIGHMIRRAMAVTPFAVAGACAVVTGLLSVTTAIPGDDSPSTLGALFGLIYGIVPASAIAMVLGPVAGLAAAWVLERDLVHSRSTALVALALLGASAVPLLRLLAWVPDDAPARVHLGAVVATMLSCAVTAECLVRWRFTATPSAVTPAIGPGEAVR